MKLYLDSLDFQLSSTQLSELKSYIGQGAIRKANQINKTTWIYIVRVDNQLVECEISYGKSTISQVKCGCGQSKSIQPCLHALICIYWQVSQKLNTENFNGSPNILKQIQSLVPQLDKETLVNYLLFALKQNPKLQSWIHFFTQSQVSSKDPFKKYDEILYEFISAHEILNKNKLSLQKVLLNIFQELYQIALQQFTQNNIKESVAALLIGIKYFHRSYSFTEIRKGSKISQLFEKYHVALFETSGTIKAPELVFQFAKQVDEIIESPTYTLFHSKYNIVNIQYTAKIPLPQPRLLILKRMFAESQIEEQKHIILQTIYETEKVLGIISIIEDKTLQLYSNFYTILVWQNTFGLKNNYSDRIQMYNALYSHNLIKGSRKLIADSMLEAMIIANDTVHITQYSRQFLMELSELKYAKIFFESTQLNVKQKKALLSELRMSANNKLSQKDIWHIMGLSNGKEELILSLKGLDNPKEIFEFDTYFLPDHSQQLLELYIHVTQSYLSLHAGPIASETLKSVKHHLSIQFGSSEIREFQQKIQSTPYKTKSSESKLHV